jgi:alpha-methylacyl-CoA racemase
MVDGVSLLAQLVWSMRSMGAWSGPRGGNLLDGGAPFYDCYTCADGRFVAVAALEPPFYAALLSGLGLADADLPAQYDPRGWPRLRETLTEALGRRTRDEWAEVFEGTDACVTPVLTWDEAAAHGHLVARGTLVEVDGVVQAAPAPRFSRTATPPVSRIRVGDDTDAVLAEWGADIDEGSIGAEEDRP